MVKYRLSYRSDADILFRVDILNDDYTGDIISVRGVSRQACTISYTGDTDDPYTAFIKSSANINFYNQGQVDTAELRQAQDRDFRVEVYRAGVLFWSGFVIPDGIQQPLKSGPSEVQITATDGLSLLENMPYSHNNLPGTTSDLNRCPMNYIRQILFSTNNLGNPLPINWVNTLECTAFPGEDMFTGSVRWAQHGEGFASYQTNAPDKTCLYILENILKSAQCNIKQTAGKWVVRRVNDTVTGAFTTKEIAADLGVMTVVTNTIDVNKTIGSGGYRFVNENDILTTKKGVKTCKVTYEADVRENILPNGNQDLSVVGFPLYWGTTGDATALTDDPIDGREGHATIVTNGVGGASSDVFGLQINAISPIFSEGLPIDTFTLVKKLNFGFIFEPLNGFPFNSGTGIIDFGDSFQIQIEYYMEGVQYYLNEFGFWTTTLTWISISVQGAKINDIIQIDFNKNNAIILPRPTTQPVAGSVGELYIYFKVNDGQAYTLDYIHFGIDENNDVYESTYESSKNTAVDERTLNISSSFGGYMLSNYMTEFNKSDDECFYKDGTFYTGTLTGLTAAAIMRFMYTASDIYNGSIYVNGADWSFDEIYTILGKKFMPLNASYNTETAQVNLVAMECRNDAVSLTEKHYGSNDQTLSN